MTEDNMINAVSYSDNESIKTRGEIRKLAPWFCVLVGLCAMYIPTFIGLFQGIWSSDEQMHGPIVFTISLWLLYRKWPDLLVAGSIKQKKTGLSWLILIVGLLLYIVGRSQNITLFEVGSIIWLLLGIGLLLFGTHSIKTAWFPLFFMLFMIPLPSVIVETITMPMKIAVSYVAEQTLYAVGYPIARNGVVLQIGQYRLLVATACAGLHTLFTLEALGLLYLNLVRYESLIRNITIAILIIPISFTANVIRVIVLTLITYHFGDDAGQGFLHGFSGMVLFLSALLLIIATDALARRLFARVKTSNNI